MITNKPQPEPWAIALELDEILTIAVDGITGEVQVQDPGDAVLDREFEAAKQTADFSVSAAGFIALVRDLVKCRRLIAETSDFLQNWREARSVYVEACRIRTERLARRAEIVQELAEIRSDPASPPPGALVTTEEDAKEAGA